MASPAPNLYSFSDNDALAQQLRPYVLRCQNTALTRHTSFRVAVSGGSLPTVLAKALLAPGDGTPEDTPQFDKWDVFFADERAVPLDHEDSNYRLLKDELVDKIPSQLGKPRVHAIDANHVNDDDPQELADLYQEELMHIFAAKDSVKLPVFDLILLGCGPDGHTCSLFPGHELLREKDAWVAAESNSPKPPPKRITLTLPVVTHAIQIAFVATGAGKKEIMKQIFDAGEDGNLPAALVNQGAGDKVSWFTDHAAVDGWLTTPRKPSTVGRTTTATATSTAAVSKENAPNRPNKSLLPVRDEVRPSGIARPQKLEASRPVQRSIKPPSKSSVSLPQRQDSRPQSSSSESTTTTTTTTTTAAPVARRQSLVRPSPLKSIRPLQPPPANSATTPRRTTPAVGPPSPSKQNARPISPRKPSSKNDMLPPPRPTRSASLRQPASSSAGAGAPTAARSHVRHRSQVLAPTSTQTARKLEPPSPTTAAPRSRTQFSTYQQHFSPKKATRPPPAAAPPPPSASGPALDPSLILPSSAPELAALQTELLQLNLLHLCSTRQDAEWKADAETHLRSKYDAVAKSYRVIVGQEKDHQRQINGQALQHWVQNCQEHNGHQGFAEQIQVLSQVAQEVCDLTESPGSRYPRIVQDFEEWFLQAEEIQDYRAHPPPPGDPAPAAVFIDPLDGAWKESAHALGLKLEHCLRQLQSLDILGYGAIEEQLEQSALVRTARRLDEMIAMMVEELTVIRRIESDVVKSERRWVSELAQQLTAAPTPPTERGPRCGVWSRAY
ncbi:nagb/rpia/CoA transferase-like protein [Aspergillus candidus]|uniref:6-phosphogluconolactonase n=1 Tax=Aspergillus candidus TaxID=41067 RepID=A0A2I2FLG6_ASPCN|nr:nagb/rpia/CoA transferase-like protein [Aspergillus candidus]PLB41475.1 nagb/rpia/CoA transferase-like protein [Aspergillus candidus]